MIGTLRNQIWISKLSLSGLFSRSGYLTVQTLFSDLSYVFRLVYALDVILYELHYTTGLCNILLCLTLQNAFKNGLANYVIVWLLCVHKSVFIFTDILTSVTSWMIFIKIHYVSTNQLIYPVSHPTNCNLFCVKRMPLDRKPVWVVLRARWLNNRYELWGMRGGKPRESE